MPDEADLVLAGGPVLTMDPEAPEVEAAAILGGRVVARGRAADVLVHAADGTRILDLDGRAAVPGFVDAHTHPVDAGVHLDRLDLSEAATREEALDRVEAAAGEAGEGEPVVAFGWDESRWPSGEVLDRGSLDAAAGGVPVLAERADRHRGAANTAALEALPVEAGDHPDGLLDEEPLFEALEALAPDEEGRAEALERFAEVAHARGVTSVHAMVGADDLRALDRARAGGRLDLRVRAYLLAEDLDALPEARPPPDPWLRLQGVKAFADGSLGARTAALSESYADAPDERGTLLRDVPDLAGVLAEAGERGLQAAVHAIGDRAVDAVLEALEEAEVPPASAPRIEHAELPPEDGVERFRQRGVVASCQPNFVGRWGGEDRMYARRLGPDRAARADPFRAYLEAGVPLAFGSDHMPFGPLVGTRGAVDAPHPPQRLEVGEALRAYTRGAAAAAGDAPQVGVLAQGSLGDVAVLSRDPRREAVDLEEVQVDLTVLGGEVVHEDGA